MAIRIDDNNSSIKITKDAVVRNLMKSQIIEISVIKNNIVKIDIGQGALHNIFIPYAEVTFPVTANPAALRDAISALLNPVADAGGGGTDGLATEAKQDSELAKLDTLKGSIDTLKSVLDF